LREMLFRVLEKGERMLSQAGLARQFGISTSTVNHCLEPLRQMNAVEVRPRSLAIVNERKILLYWASKRNLKKETAYATRTVETAEEVEKSLPPGTALAAFSAYKQRFGEAPADYGEVYCYAGEEELEEIKRRFPARQGPANLFVLKKDEKFDEYGKITLAQTYVDLWNIGTWNAQEVLKKLDEKIGGGE